MKKNIIQYPKYSLFILLGILLCLLAVVTAWFGVEKARLAYEVEQYRGLVREKTEFITKLETERDLLLSPTRLITYAKKNNLHPAKTGQLRTLRLPEADKNTNITITLE